MLDHLEHDESDVLVIGGGITGAGVALDTAAALAEATDFAAVRQPPLGTSPP